MTAKVILNPYAGRWEAKRRKSEAETALQASGISYEWTTSQAPGHGVELAERAVLEGFDPIIAAGGDSTFNEVVNGMIHAVDEAPLNTHLGILPLGTANDLADNLSIPKDLSAASEVIASGHSRRMDVGWVNQRYFVNNSAIGLETTVTVIQMNMRHVRGVVRYLLATFIAIYRNPQWVMDLTWDEGSYHGPVTLVSVGNNPRTGGVFYTVPNADPFDGKLSFVYGSVPTRFEILRILPRTMQPEEGNYTQHPAVHEIHTKRLKIRTQPATPLHTDGELIDMATHTLEYRVHPERIPILIP